MAKVQVRVHLGSPLYINTVKGKNPIQLDAVLGLIWMEEQGHKKTSVELCSENLVFPELPIRRVEKCYLASGMILPKKFSSSIDFLTKRSNYSQRISRTSPSFLPTGTCFNPAIMKYWALACDHVDFFADVTDTAEFIRLLKQLEYRGLGAKTAVGYGRITKIECVTKNESEETRHCLTKDGLPTRPLPVELFKGKVSESAAIGWSNYYAPYWFRKNQTKCYLPDLHLFNPLPMLTESDYANIEADLLYGK